MGQTSLLCLTLVTVMKVVAADTEWAYHELLKRARAEFDDYKSVLAKRPAEQLGASLRDAAPRCNISHALQPCAVM